MSEYNRRESSNTQGQSIPGTSAQQMWHVLNFHEQRLQQLTQHLQEQQSQQRDQPKTRTNPKKTKTSSKDLGEYIDYEEID